MAAQRGAAGGGGGQSGAQASGAGGSAAQPRAPQPSTTAASATQPHAGPTPASQPAPTSETLASGQVQPPSVPSSVRIGVPLAQPPQSAAGAVAQSAGEGSTGQGADGLEAGAKRPGELDAAGSAKKAKVVDDGAVKDKEDFDDMLKLGSLGIELDKEDPSLSKVPKITGYRCTEEPFLNFTRVGNKMEGAFISRLHHLLLGHENQLRHVENAAVDLLDAACQQHIRAFLERLVKVADHRVGAEKDQYSSYDQEALTYGFEHSHLESQTAERKAQGGRVEESETQKRTGSAGEVLGGGGKGLMAGARKQRKIGLEDLLFVLERERGVGAKRILLRYYQKLDPAIPR